MTRFNTSQSVGYQPRQVPLQSARHDNISMNPSSAPLYGHVDDLSNKNCVAGQGNALLHSRDHVSSHSDGTHINSEQSMQYHYPLLFLPNTQTDNQLHQTNGKVRDTQHSTSNPNLLLQILSKVLDRLIDDNSKNCCLKEAPITKFHSSYQPDVTIFNYMERIRKYANCHDSCFVVALIYIDRLIMSQQFILSNLNVHRLLITSMMLAVKFYEDDFYKNTFYAKLGGIPPWEMNCLEVELLRLLNFNLVVSATCFSKYYNELKQHGMSMSIPHQVSHPPSPVDVTVPITNPPSPLIYGTSHQPHHWPRHALNQHQFHYSPMSYGSYHGSPMSQSSPLMIQAVMVPAGVSAGSQYKPPTGGSIATSNTPGSVPWYSTLCNPLSAIGSNQFIGQSTPSPLMTEQNMCWRQHPQSGSDVSQTSTPGSVHGGGVYRFASSGFVDGSMSGSADNYSPMVGNPIMTSLMTNSAYNSNVVNLNQNSKDPSPRGVDQYWMQKSSSSVYRPVQAVGTNGYYLHHTDSPGTVHNTGYVSDTAQSYVSPVVNMIAGDRRPSFQRIIAPITGNSVLNSVSKCTGYSRANESNSGGFIQYIPGIASTGVNHVPPPSNVAAAYHQHLNTSMSSMSSTISGASSSFMVFNL